jgi:hypothetical protein
MSIAARNLLFAVLAIAATGCIASDDAPPDATFIISNRSSYFLDEIRLAPIGSANWGPDLVDSLAPGEDLVIRGIACDTYDILVTDETGVDCELGNIDICVDTDGWVVDDLILDTCAFNPAR